MLVQNAVDGGRNARDSSRRTRVWNVSNQADDKGMGNELFRIVMAGILGNVAKIKFGMTI